MAYNLSEEGRLQKIKNLGQGMLGKKHSKETRRKIGDSNSITLEDSKGYLKEGRFFLCSKGKIILRSHYKWMNHNGFWYIPDGYVVHHVDGDKINDSPENLILISSSEHTRLHNKIELMKDPSRKYWGKNQHMRGG